MVRPTIHYSKPVERDTPGEIKMYQPANQINCSDIKLCYKNYAPKLHLEADKIIGEVRLEDGDVIRFAVPVAEIYNIQKEFEKAVEGYLVCCKEIYQDPCPQSFREKISIAYYRWTNEAADSYKADLISFLRLAEYPDPIADKVANFIINYIDEDTLFEPNFTDSLYDLVLSILSVGGGQYAANGT